MQGPDHGNVSCHQSQAVEAGMAGSLQLWIVACHRHRDWVCGVNPTAPHGEGLAVLPHSPTCDVDVCTWFTTVASIRRHHPKQVEFVRAHTTQRLALRHVNTL